MAKIIKYPITSLPEPLRVSASLLIEIIEDNKKQSFKYGVAAGFTLGAAFVFIAMAISVALR